MQAHTALRATRPITGTRPSRYPSPWRPTSTMTSTGSSALQGSQAPHRLKVLVQEMILTDSPITDGLDQDKPLSRTPPRIRRGVVDPDRAARYYPDLGALLQIYRLLLPQVATRCFQRVKRFTTIKWRNSQ
ncbi:MAG: hypothetical protein HY717_04220 [Planctomycetes bacterium]|nr:hypothetical protein [Planctomycetota bacterium]